MSERETDNLEVSEPERNETRMVICLCCGNVFEGDDNTTCERCKVSNNVYRTRFEKWVRSE